MASNNGSRLGLASAVYRTVRAPRTAEYRTTDAAALVDALNVVASPPNRNCHGFLGAADLVLQLGEAGGSASPSSSGISGVLTALDDAHQ